MRSPKKPDLSFGEPLWYIGKGMKFSGKYSPKEKSLVLEASAATATISRAENNRGYLVDYVIRHSKEASSSGIVWMSDKDIRSAFGFSDDYDEIFGQELIDRFGGDAARQGCYIRYKKFLNIPCPGTGHNGDPNVSIFLSDDLKREVEFFLG